MGFGSIAVLSVPVQRVRRSTTGQCDPPQYHGREDAGRGEWRPADRDRARVTNGPHTPDGGHAIGFKEPRG